MRPETGFNLGNGERHAGSDVACLHGLLNDQPLQPPLLCAIGLLAPGNACLRCAGRLGVCGSGHAVNADAGQREDQQGSCRDLLHWPASRPMPAIRSSQSGVSSAISIVRPGYRR